MHSIIRSVVPERHFDPRKKDPLPWERFVAACALHDPPETDLEALANYAGPYPQLVTPLDPSEGKQPDTEEELLLMVEPPIVQLRDWNEQRRIVEDYWWSVLSKVWELYLKPNPNCGSGRRRVLGVRISASNSRAVAANYDECRALKIFRKKILR